MIGLQTNFGGGKTHTMLALHHLAGATETGYPPGRLDGMGPIFEAAGVETLGRVTRAVFVCIHKGAAESMHAENGRLAGLSPEDKLDEAARFAAAIGMSLSSLAVAGNALRLGRGPDTTGG